MSPRTATKSTKKKSGRKLPTIADYSDFVDDKHLERIKALASDDDMRAAEQVAESAW